MTSGVASTDCRTTARSQCSIDALNAPARSTLIVAIELVRPIGAGRPRS